MMKTIITLTVAAVLFAITSNVAEAVKPNPNPWGQPLHGGTVFGNKSKNCTFEHSSCIWGDYTAEDVAGCLDGRYGKICRKKNIKARCDREYKKCSKPEKKKIRGKRR